MGEPAATRIELTDPITQLPGIGPSRAKLLAKLRIRTVGDLLWHIPRTYEDRRVITPVAALTEGMTATVCAEVASARAIRLRRSSIAEVTFRDNTGEVRATWFGRGFLARTFREGARVVLTGTVGNWKGLALKNPDYEILNGEDDALGRIVPVYPLTDGVTQRMLRGWVGAALEACLDSVEETLPRKRLAERGFPTLRGALQTVHAPDDLDDVEAARRRLAYEELLAMQRQIQKQRRTSDERAGQRHTIDGARLAALRDALPFKLTPGQAKAVADILADMASPRPMRRLLQGDVGCGKTAVALHAIAAAADGGYQSAFMAPTELLAEQHFMTLRAALAPIGLSTALLTGSTSSKALRDEIAAGAYDVVIGTHALFQEKTAFRRLGFGIVDEQHRFGVAQRTRLTRKGAAPDILHMTATPIPRSLALTMYGAFDISIIRDLPPGRKPVKTSYIPADKEDDLYAFIVEEAKDGRQTYFVCPLIDESETKTVAALTTRYEALAAGPLASVRTAMVHGRMRTEEKEAALRRFAAKDFDVLFATSIIEVGINVPSATIMVLDDAAQFGLTQLHQLRGRVGRGAEQSFCFLLGAPRTEEGKARLEILTRCSSGFEIAEEDLKLRGPGEVYGARQAGLSDFRAANVLRDLDLLEAARADAQRLS